jgi:hypothetical protein
VALVLRNITRQLSDLDPEPIELPNEVPYLARGVGIRAWTFQRVLLGSVVARHKPITQFQLGRIAEAHVNDAMRDVVSLTGEMLAFGTNEVVKPLFQ